ncbi:MAG: DNA mismatch repair endonuclease MutL [Chlorobium sp.]|jgi:DNA mismatch repair protein MutL|uniref:DNA mismatch repair endonuclease MutL n=1 Tax=Chlorobium sp. TaxID=1095 RepID=UPI001D1DA39F|nr:DNA mismatch repair endonuclease MutL [Chlorobium sp.]MBN1278667.1 DNA mismatch repair endonuclease MutL [Chlorobiaceae bacterium]MCF8216687.1 DNA mismatch repair endonuclease MutL [Chlorobium sp.]MCF8270852.1 DNA mismatch repair endonuclease MutL [Chlorobium sp.]MCF8287214.1 DNA mismatch repair endonuclease MutL [Chlorobium sp.]MCF8290872.1 DNA mismatch repair endonuclease MutL [Chlorobium sp.]
MSKISRLPDTVANKISAGEVVQRPASVVKELLENAIDAGASRITIMIKDAGKELIRIIDNGSGMSRQDALLSVERFATSKISGVEDLDTLMSLGFRGEALASISSVSHFELKTRQEDALLACKFRYEGGVLVEESEIAAEEGTSISVRNLFYNVPARRKFLKSNATEFRHIFEAVRAHSLAYADIEWRMFSDDEELFHFRSPDIYERLDYYYGSGFSEGLIPITEENDYLSIHGFIGKPGMMKRQKFDQLFYVNRRIIQNRMLSQALQQAYGELLEERQAPFALLFLGIEPSRIDVNVHPAKLEVKFEDERNVRNMFYPVIKRSVQLHDFSPDASFAPPTVRQGGGALNDAETLYRKLQYNELSGRTGTTEDLYGGFRENSLPSSSRQGATAQSRQGEMFPVREPYEGWGNGPVAVQSEDFPPTMLQSRFHDDEGAAEPEIAEPKIWQLHNKYIICQIKNGMMIIDQHVAHERVLYERALDVMNQNVPNSQQLLFPQKVELRQWEYEVFEDIRDDLYRLGFNLRDFGSRTVMIEGIPQDVRSGTEVTILQDMIAGYQENASKLKLEKRDNLAKSYSCRNAIMAGQKLGLEEMRSLIDNLFATRVPYSCPHGRPVIVKLMLDQLDRMFGRT